MAASSSPIAHRARSLLQEKSAEALKAKDAGEWAANGSNDDGGSGGLSAADITGIVFAAIAGTVALYVLGTLAVGALRNRRQGKFERFEENGLNTINPSYAERGYGFYQSSPSSSKYPSVPTNALPPSSIQLSSSGLLKQNPSGISMFAEQRFGLGGRFELLELAGQGNFGETWVSKDKTTNRIVAVKLQQRPISSVHATMAYNEIVVQGTLSEGCTFLTPIYEAILTPTHVALLMEYENGGNFANYVANRVPDTPQNELILPEDEARYFFKQLVAGIFYMHSRNTGHRDIKLCNCLLDYVDGNGNDNSNENIIDSRGKGLPILKLADFQFVYSCTDTSSPQPPALLGTPVYMAPEILETRFKPSVDRQQQQQDDQRSDKYDPCQADVWAAGIWLVAALIGAFPFDYKPGSDNVTAARQILQEQEAMSWKESSFVKPYLRRMSPALQDLLHKMLETDPEKRITIAGVKIHPWVSTSLQTPQLEEKWSELQEQQAVRKQTVVEMPLDQHAFDRRNEAVWHLVTEAQDLQKVIKYENHQLLYHQRHYEHENGASSSKSGGANSGRHQIEEILKQDPSSRKYIDTESIPGGCRIDMRLSALSIEV